MNFSGFKSGYPLAIRSFVSVVTFWFLLFLIFSVARSLSESFVPAIGMLSDASTPALATSILQLGLGGTIVGGLTLGDVGGTATLAVLLLIVPIALFYSMRAIARRYQITARTNVQGGVYSAIGAALAVAVLAFLSSGNNVIGSTTATLGYAWLVPALAAAILGFAVVPGAIATSSAARLIPSAQVFAGAFRGTAKLLVFVAVVSAYYVALTMGTGLNLSAPLWAWPLVALIFALTLPTITALVMPIFLGAVITYSGAALAAAASPSMARPYSTLFSTQYSWVAWVIFSVAWLAVIVAAVKHSNRNVNNKWAWVQLPIVNAVVALLLTWLGSFRISGSASVFTFLDAAPSFGNEGFTTVAVFAIAGLLYGLIAHPALKPFTRALDESIGSAARKLIKALTFALSLRWIAPLNALWNGIASQKFFARKAITYALVGGVTGVFFLLGAPLAAVTSPFYDNQTFADGPLVSALQTGDAVKLAKVVLIAGKTFLASNGLGANASTTVTHPKDLDQTQSQVAWGENSKYFLKLEYTRSTSKAPFLTVIPQWDVSIVGSSLPTLTITNGKNNLHYLQVGSKSYPVADVVLLPGLAEVAAGVDKEYFLQSNKVMVNVAKDASADFKITLNTSKTSSVFDNVASAMQTQYTDCKTLTFKGSTVDLGSADLTTGLPTLKIKGGGLCDSKTSGKLPYTVVASGTYSFDSSSWVYTYEFK